MGDRGQRETRVQREHMASILQEAAGPDLANRMRAAGLMVMAYPQEPIGQWVPIAGWAVGKKEYTVYCRPGEQSRMVPRAKRLMFGQ